MVCMSKDKKLEWSVYGRGLRVLNFLLMLNDGAPVLAQMWDTGEEGMRFKSYEQLHLPPLVLIVCSFSMRSWYLFCKTAAEATPVPTVTDEKLKGVKSENNDDIHLKWQGRMVLWWVQFKIRRHTALNKLMKAYWEWQGLSVRQIRFRFDGQSINEKYTSAKLEMEDKDTIAVFQQQVGGIY